MRVVGISDIARGDALLQYPEWPLPAEILMNHERPARVLRGHDHGACVGKGFRKRFLADRRSAMRQRQAHQLAMRLRGGRDIDEVRRFGLQHLRCVGVDAIDTEARSHRAGSGMIDIANRNYLRTRLPMPRFHMVASEKPAANERPPVN